MDDQARKDDQSQLEAELHEKQAQLDAAMEQVAGLMGELEHTNQGLIALHRELEEAREAEVRLRLAEGELAEVRTAQEILAERDRVAMDLHDRVIQRLFASGINLQAALGLADSPTLRARLENVVDELDATIKEIRSVIFGLTQPPEPIERREPAGLHSQLLAITSQAAEILGFEPRVSVRGKVDGAASPQVTSHLLAVAREALSNTARHAHASRVEVDLEIIGKEILLAISDNGTGIGEVTRRSGLANMAGRAKALGGTFQIYSDSGGRGTRLEWRVPSTLPRAATQ